jgi:hypothetical protein
MMFPKIFCKNAIVLESPKSLCGTRRLQTRNQSEKEESSSASLDQRRSAIIKIASAR